LEKLFANRIRCYSQTLFDGLPVFDGLLVRGFISRRDFLKTCGRVGAAVPATQLLSNFAFAAPAPPTAGGTPLARRFRDLSRHFVFEYYPWYGLNPIRHWDQWDRKPPVDIAANHVPLLGAYDSRSKAVLEQHAQWIADSGVGAINVSWWGPGSYEDQAVPLIMDVMHDHDIKVTFHLEPYSPDHAYRYSQDILYLIREYGEKRRYDALLILEDAVGNQGPVLKGFRTLVSRDVIDCHGTRLQVPDYADASVWAGQLEAVRFALRREFDMVWLLSDTLDVENVAKAGFDGIAIYDPHVGPSQYPEQGKNASNYGLFFSFNINCGFDSIEPRIIPPDSCYAPSVFSPDVPALDWTRADDREIAARAVEERINDCVQATVDVQTDPALTNARRGFFLSYVTSFNEWHEGHAFEPMADFASLTPQQQALGYHNPAHGGHRLAALTTALDRVLTASTAARTGPR
jgi:hypothetical protein